MAHSSQISGAQHVSRHRQHKLGLGARKIPALAWKSLALSLCLFCNLAQAQADAAGKFADLSAALDLIRTDLSNAEAIQEEPRKVLEDIIAKGQDAVDSYKQSAESRVTLEAQVAKSDQLIADYKRRVADIQSAPATLEQRLGADPDLDAITAEISVVGGQRSSWSDERTLALDTLAGMARYETDLRSRLSDLNRRIATADESSAAVDNDDDASLELRANQIANALELMAAEQEVALIELQLRSQPTLSALRTAKIAWLDAAISESDALLEELRGAAANRRASAAAQRSAEMRRTLSDLADASPTFQDFARKNLALVNELQQLGQRIAGASRRLASLRQTRESIQQDASLTERRLEVAGLEAELGEVMTSRLASLPDPRRILARNDTRNKLIAAISIDAIDTEQDLRESGDRASFLAQNFGDVSSFDAAQTRDLDRLYVQRQELLQETLQSQNTLLRALVDENQAVAELAQEAEDYETLLTANLLWVRNYSFADPQRLMERLALLISASPLERILSNWPLLLSDAGVLLPSLLLMLLIYRKPSMKRWLQETLGNPIRPRDERTRLVMQATALTFLTSLPLSIVVAILARCAEVLASGDLMLLGAAGALYAVAVLLLLFRFFTSMAGRLGAGRRLLKWNGMKADLMLSAMRWFRPSVLLGIALGAFGGGLSPTDSGGALGALGSLVLALSMFTIAVQLLRSGLFSVDRVILLVLRGVALIAAAIVVMHASGQLFAAHLYLRALGGSILAVLGTLLVTNILMRSLLIHRARMERRTREDLRAREESEGDDDLGADVEEIDVETLSEAYRRLLGLARVLALGAMLWVIWAPALPALSIFDAVTLWSTTDTSIADGGIRNVTLGVLLFAVAIVGLTLVITQQLPPLVNVILMEWTSVTPGSRYAAGMLMQYVIIGVGFSIALVMLGFQWAKVQWLVAALGVGIGFGLQEIVANFISGLIVLFERPIRVGDIINAGSHDGTVTKINARATVIETFEGKELMIPNKELITSVVTNWSLSSSKLRIVIPIGIAYGSDADDAMLRLKRIAGQHPEILHDPEPWVSFEDFGDNALVLWLRCYALRDFVRVATELRQTIYRDFNDAGIGIAFPQRDIHLDASEPIPVRVMPND